MSDQPQIQYQVTEEHMCLLSRIVQHGTLETCLGQAKFLALIAPVVWPGLRLEVAAHFGDPGAAEPPATVQGLVMDMEVLADNARRLAEGRLPSSDSLWKHAGTGK